MMWHKNRTYQQTRLVWQWKEVWATIGVSLALVAVLAVLFYGYGL